MTGLKDRQVEPEIMDGPDLDPAAHRAALLGLGRINRVSRSAALVWPVLREAARAQARPLRVLDIACGGGDVVVALLRRARREGVPLAMSGCDISDVALEVARGQAQDAGVEARFFRHDALAERPPERSDVTMTSLFLHHLSHEDGATLLRNMRQASRWVVVNDLERSTAGYGAAWMGTRILTRSGVVHIDGPRSVRAAFTAEELRDLAEQAGLIGATIHRRWPFRLLLTWRAAA